MQTIVGRARQCCGELRPPGDKSITHRGLMLGAIAHGTTLLLAPLDADDTRSTVQVLRQLGVHVATPEGGPWQVKGLGAGRFPGASADPGEDGPLLDCGNSGTTLRLLLGVLAGRGAGACLTGDASLRRRPMARIAQPLAQFGALVTCTVEGTAPVRLRAAAVGPSDAAPLQAATVTLAVASAQVKSAALLAALGARGTSVVQGATASRDHTERMLRAFGAELAAGVDGALSLTGPQALQGRTVVVPGDPSAAAFFWAAAAVVPGGDITVRGVALNPTRLGFLRLLGRMGARVDVHPHVHGAAADLQPGAQWAGTAADGAGAAGHAGDAADRAAALAADAVEPVGDVRVRHAPLHGCTLAADEVAATIDELPLVAVVACAAQGTTRVAGAAELRRKESDRIAAMAHNIAALGGTITTVADGFSVTGGVPLRGNSVQSLDDHRIAMATAIAALLAEGTTTLTDDACVAVSYPNFFAELDRLTGACPLAPRRPATAAAPPQPAASGATPPTTAAPTRRFRSPT